MVQEPDAAPLILLSFTHMTKREKIEAALTQAEKLAIASRLAAPIAHEIKNPFEAITNLLYLASTGDDTATAKGYLPPMRSKRMWVSAQLVVRLQGDLRVSSTARLGRSGTAFSLFLPFDLWK